MDINYYKQYEPLFGAWYIKELIGEGSFGQVYRIERSDISGSFEAALKAITIPKSQSEIKSVIADGMDVSQYYREVVEGLASEFVMLSKFKGNSNIVSYEDHKIIEHPDKIGYDILIRMELLTPLFDYIIQNKFTKRDVIKLGIDLCKAIELCQKYNIIHRDIKPENIFISRNGDYKLGDFGIAKAAEKNTSGMSKKGTYAYMAPEIYRGESNYDSTVDIYSLGIVMYRLLNGNRTPFLPEYPLPINHDDKEAALTERTSGAKIPPPKNAPSGRLSEIVLKACEYKPKDRYSSAVQMRTELEAILYDKNEADIVFPEGDEIVIDMSKGSVIKSFDTGRSTGNDLEEYSGPVTVKDIDDENTVSVFGAPELDIEVHDFKEFEEKNEDTVSVLDNPKSPEDPVNEVDTDTTVILYNPPIEVSSVEEVPEEKTNLKKWIIAAGSIIAVAVIAVCLLIPHNPKISGIDSTIEFEKGQTYELEYIVEPKRFADKPIDFSTGDTSIAKVSDNEIKGKKVEIKGEKVGETQLKATIDDYSEEYKIVVKPATVTAIKGVKSSIKIAKGSSKRIKPDIEPKAAQDRKVHYSIKDESIAKVSSSGKITGKKKGKTTLVIKVGNMQKEVKVTVYKKKKTVTKTPTYTAPTNNYVDPNTYRHEYWE